MARRTTERGGETNGGERPMSAREKLLGKAGKAAPKATAATKNRDLITVGDSPETRVIAQAVDRLTTLAKNVKVLQGHERAARAIAVPYLQGLVLDNWLDLGTKGENPKIQTPSGASFILQCKDTLSGARGWRLPKGDDGEPVDIKQHLINHGVSARLVDRLIEEEEFVDQQLMTIPIDKLEKENRPLSERLMEMIIAANEGGVKLPSGKTVKFSDAELSQLVETVHDVKMKENFLSRIVGHVKAVAEHEEEQKEFLQGILNAVPPQWAVSSVNPGMNEETVLREVIREPAPVASPASAEPKDHDAGPFTIRQEGFVLTVIRKTDNKKMATKKCKDGDHVENTIKKWQREPASLTGFISENS